jgi:hypothetical protein
MEQKRDVEQAVLAWCDETDDIEYDRDQSRAKPAGSRGFGPHSLEVSTRGPSIVVKNGGSMALQGEFDGLELDHGHCPVLYVRGTRHWADANGRRESQGRFAVFANDIFEIDGPLPE